MTTSDGRQESGGPRPRLLRSAFADSRVVSEERRLGLLVDALRFLLKGRPEILASDCAQLATNLRAWAALPDAAGALVERSVVALLASDTLYLERICAEVEAKLGLAVRDVDCIPTAVDRSMPLRAQMELTPILHNLRSAFNVGNCFRIADCFHCHPPICSGFTPRSDNERVRRTALGTAKTSGPELLELRDWLVQRRELGWGVYCLETLETATPLASLAPVWPAVLVLGNERWGLSNEIVEVCHPVAIPMHGRKNSLNVGNAFAIAAHQFRLTYDAEESGPAKVRQPRKSRSP